MNEQVDHPTPEDGWRTANPSAESTGNEAVDAVLRSLDDLDGRPLDAHVAVFESAHERLRAALNGTAEAPDRSAARQR